MTTFTPLGADLFGEPVRSSQDQGPLGKRFLIPPFSVLNTREGIWQERKAAWIGLGIKSELGRGGQLIPNGGGMTSKTRYDASPGGSARPACDYSNRERGTGSGRAIAGSEAGQAQAKTFNCGTWMAKKAGGSRGNETGTSIFDPVLCELAYRWFCPPGGQVLDPFAGGSVRGIVAGKLGLRYYGIDLSDLQVAANREQAETITPENPPAWACGDSMQELDGAPEADFIFSCPPYGDLEQYSDDPRDLSRMDYHTFVATYKNIIFKAYRRLRNDRFACFVVGEFRDPKGNYRNFVGDTIAGFLNCRMSLYNEAILVTAVGSLPIRVGRQFVAGRKLGKTHQNVLVFLKGDAKRAARACQWVDEV